jgi:ATP-dependent DNA ligase
LPRRAPEFATLAPMEARLVDALPSGAGWQFEPKWDGFRCLASRNGQRIEMAAKSGKTLARYFPEMVEQLAALDVRNDSFVLDGELAVPIGSTLDFEALQMRLHPAESRIRKLSRETPAIFIVFDLLVAPGGQSLIDRALKERRVALESFFAALRSSSSLRL